MYDIYQQSALGVKKCKVNNIVNMLANNYESLFLRFMSA